MYCYNTSYFNSYSLKALNYIYLADLENNHHATPYLNNKYKVCLGLLKYIPNIGPSANQDSARLSNITSH